MPISIDAGSLASWVAAFEEARRGDGAMDVPCGDCTACCRASQFIHVGPDEADALAHIPAEILVPAPGAPPGTRVMGYDEDGCCPMFDGERCSIYDHRPRACRTYDCRVFAAAGVDPDPGRDDLAARVARWRFSLTGSEADDEADLHRAIRDTARLLADHRDAFSPPIPRASIPLALLAIELHGVLVKARRGGAAPPDPTLVQELQRALAARQSARTSRRMITPSDEDRRTR